MSRILLLLGLTALVTGIVAGPAEAAARPVADPVLADVLRMLEEGVGSPVIVDWLALQPGPSPVPTPDDLIKLKRAGASDVLIQKLLDRASAAPAPPAPSQWSAGPTASPVPIAPPAPPADGMAGVAVTLRFRSFVDEDDDFEKKWTLLAYLDGDPILGTMSRREPVNTIVRMAPGKHRLRLLRESHVKRGDRWIHESFAAPHTAEFEVTPGDGWSLVVEWLEPVFTLKDRNPFKWALSRWDAPVADASPAGDDLDQWPRLCDDTRANVREGQKTPGWVSRELKGCVEWSSLWQGLARWPDRPAVLHRLEQNDFKPPM